MATFARATLWCVDLERSKRFYRTIFDLPVVTEGPGWVELAMGNGTILALHAQTESGAARRQGTVQLGFSVEDVDTFVTDARTALVTVLQEPHDQPSGRVAVVADPDGNPLFVLAPLPLSRSRR